MKQQLFAIEDVVIGRYNAPFMCENEVIAQRMLRQSVKQDQGFMENPADYRLVLLADYDQVTGEIVPLNSPKLIVKVEAIVNSVRGEK